MDKLGLILNRGGLFLLCILLCSFGNMAYAKKFSVPLSLDYSMDVVDHSVTVTTLEVTAQATLKQVKLTVTPYKNIELLSVVREASFDEVVMGQVVRFKVKTRRVDETNVAYLAVNLQSTNKKGDVRTSVVTIRYGEVKQPIQEPVHKSVTALPGSDQPRQEPLIRMPASPR